MLTIFHVVGLGAGIAGAVFGGMRGAEAWGIAGSVIGVFAGGYVGLLLGGLPQLFALWCVARSLTPKTTPELRAYLRSPECLTPNCVLLELKNRGEDIQPELDFVVDLLASEDVSRRGFGWAALTSAYPELAERIPDYKLNDSVEDCRRKTERLRATDSI